MPKAKKSEWHLDYGTWSFSADKLNAPVLTIDFTKPQGLKEKGETAREHYLGALRFLENSGFNSNATNGNRFDSSPLRDRQEVITLAGVDNIRHLARLMHKRPAVDVVKENLAVVPERLGGTGRNVPGDNYRDPTGDLFHDGHIDPNAAHTARVAERKWQQSVSVKGGVSTVTVTDQATGHSKTADVPSEDIKVIGRVTESLIRRLDYSSPKNKGGPGH